MVILHTSAVTGNAGIWTVVVAGGSGQRFGADKLAVVLRDDETVLDMSVAKALAHSAGVVVVVPADSVLLRLRPANRLTFVPGGHSRAESARNGLASVPVEADTILVHDAARPLADGAIFERVIDAVGAGAAAVVPVIPVVDTIRHVGGGVIDRDGLRSVQTPQGFRAQVLRDAHAGGAQATDDASLVEALGHEVVLVDGEVRNLKITRPADIALARALLDEPS
jgi:2-C-methyl-D-erythritol 4-phosphate cytidylyltransferase